MAKQPKTIRKYKFFSQYNPTWNGTEWEGVHSDGVEGVLEQLNQFHQRAVAMTETTEQVSTMFMVVDQAQIRDHLAALLKNEDSRWINPDPTKDGWDFLQYWLNHYVRFYEDASWNTVWQATYGKTKDTRKADKAADEFVREFSNHFS